MILAPVARLVLVAFMLILQSSLFILELYVFIFVDPRLPDYVNHTFATGWRRWGMPLQLWAAPLSVAGTGAVIVAVMFAKAGHSLAALPNNCTDAVDGDIAGDGVIAAAIMQVGTLLIVSVLSTFHDRATGMKELGGGLLLTNISLTIALLVRLGKGTLTLPDAAIGAMIIDGQGLGLSIQLTAKEVLTSRWQVGISIMAQLCSLVAMPIIVHWFTNNAHPPNDQCGCLTIFWWGRLGNCHASSWSLEWAIFWVYLAWRVVGFVQTAFHAGWNTSAFDQAEKDIRNAPVDLRHLAGRLGKITYVHHDAMGFLLYGDYTSTISLIGTLYGLLALTSLSNAKAIMLQLNIKPSSAIDSIGQVIALVIAAATVIRAIWLFIFLFVHENSAYHGLVWPFRLPGWSVRRPVVIPADLSLSADALPLSSLLTDYHDPHSAVNQDNATLMPGPNVEVYHNNQFLIDRKDLRVDWDAVITYQNTKMMHLSFIPDEQFYTKGFVAGTGIKEMLAFGTKSLSLYLVVDLVIVKGLPEKKGGNIPNPHQPGPNNQSWLQIYHGIPEPLEDWRVYSYRVQRVTVTNNEMML